MVESHLDVGGAVTFWSLADANDRTRLHRGFSLLGLEGFVPDPRPAPAALRDALEAVLGGARTLVRPLATRDGFAVVREDRGTDTNTYATRLVARVRDGQAPAFDPWAPEAGAVAEAYARQLARVPGHQVSAALVKVVEALGGTRLRPGGAVYWVPGPRLDDWAKVAKAAEGAAEDQRSAVYVLRHRLDADAVRAVRDAVVSEVDAETRRICEEVTSGELGGRALEARRRQAFELRSKVLLYEDLLAVGLQGLHTALDAADQAAATAALLLAARGPSEPAPAGAG